MDAGAVSVYLPKDGKTYRYRFLWRGRWYRGSTGQLRKQDAELFDKKEQLRVRQEAGGVAAYDPERTPHLIVWAGTYYKEAAKRVTAPARIEALLRVVLRFWGRPTDKMPIVDGEPYHNLRLADPIVEPRWIQRFEEWMDRKDWAGQTKNQYRSVMSQMYKLAISHLWRAQTHITVNPFAGLTRDRSVGREVTLTPEQLRAVLAAASYHVRLAVAIGALAPKLRLSNILKLEWKAHFDPPLRFITVHEHKTAAATKRPLVIAISDQLRTILDDAKTRKRSPYVVSYRGEPVHSLRGGIRGACGRAGLTYGRFVHDGITFHVLRHTAATIMADLDLSDEKRRLAMGHLHASTTQKYTHLRPIQELDTMEQLSRALPIADLVVQPRLRASGKPLSAVPDPPRPRQPRKVRATRDVRTRRKQRKGSTKQA